MPSGIGASYRSLTGNVYKSTTIAENKFSMIDSFKKAFSFTPNQRSELLIEKEQPVVIARYSMCAILG